MRDSHLLGLLNKPSFLIPKPAFPGTCRLITLLWTNFVKDYFTIFVFTMAKESDTTSSPPSATPDAGVLKRSTSSTQNMRNQKSILGFFQKSSPSTPSALRSVEPVSSPAQQASEKRVCNANKTSKYGDVSVRVTQELPPVPSSDIIYTEDEEAINREGSTTEVLIDLGRFPLTGLSGCRPWMVIKRKTSPSRHPAG
jgi:hypothetical protein